jgi:protein-tyrosine phosphatase
MKITFVCTGNICRSPLAEGILRSIAPNLQVSSRGIQSYHEGEQPDYRALKIAKENGISMEGIKATQLKVEDLIENDYIFAVTKKHKEQILRFCPPELAPKVHVLLEFVGLENHSNDDILDPYYGTEEDFAETFKIILKSCQKLVEHFKTKA